MRYFFRLAVLRTWRSKHWSLATYRNLAHCFGAEKPDLVEAICQALGAPSGSTMGQQKGKPLFTHKFAPAFISVGLFCRSSHLTQWC